jgi:hypothetical protein
LLFVSAGPARPDGGSAPREDAAARLQKDQLLLREAMIARCPQQRASIAELDAAPPARRFELLIALERCADAAELFFIQLGNAQNLVGRYPDAEATFRRALAKRATESARLGLLTALSRQKSLTPAQKKDLKEGLEHFRREWCTRDDLCAGLSYVAWHAEDTDLTVVSAELAIKLGYPGWHAHFTGGTAYALRAHQEDRARAIELLQEAKRRGGPARNIDDFLARLGAP